MAHPQKGQRVIGVRATVCRYVSDDPQPGIVECELVDTYGTKWLIEDKIVYFEIDERLTSSAQYPIKTVVTCEVVETCVGDDSNIVRIDIGAPIPIKGSDDGTQFDVPRTSLVEWEWMVSEAEKRPWNGIP